MKGSSKQFKRMPREGTVGVSSREALPKSSRSFRLNSAVGRNGLPAVIGARCNCIE